MTIHAKPVIPDQYWILRDNDRKVGNIQSDHNGYVVSINGKKSRYMDLELLQTRLPVTFDRSQTSDKQDDQYQVHGFPTSSVAHNPIFDVSRHLPLWTQSPRSRSLMAAGWYRVRPHRNWQVMFCPKLILLQRYPYQGPFVTREEAMKT